MKENKTKKNLPVTKQSTKTKTKFIAGSVNSAYQEITETTELNE